MSQPSMPPTELERPPPSADRAYLLTASALLATAAWLGVWFQMVFFVPLMPWAHNHFKMKMPYFAELLVYQLWWMFPAIFVVAVLVGLSIRKRWAWSFLLIILPLLLNIVVLVSLYVPTMQLVIGVQQALAANQ